jgi:hypothetical protein
LARLLAQHSLARDADNSNGAGTLEGFTTASATALAEAFVNLLKTQVNVTEIALEHKLPSAPAALPV